METGTAAESDALTALANFTEHDLRGYPTLAVAGAALRLAVVLITEAYGPEAAARSTRQALDNVIQEQRRIVQ